LAVRREAAVVPNKRSTASCDRVCVPLTLLDADTDRAVAALRQAVPILDGVDNTFLRGVAEVSLVSALGRAGDPPEAAAGYIELFEHWAGAANQAQQLVTIRNATELLCRCGDLHTTALVYGAICKRAAAPPPGSPEATRFEAAMATTVAGLGEDRFAELRAEGESLSDQALVALVQVALEQVLPV
jgi:hypothetical protein